MNYNKLGNTGLSVSEIGLGCEGLIDREDEFVREMFDLALKSGINIMDMYTPNPKLHRIVGDILAPIRDKFYLQVHLCSMWENRQYRATRDLDEVKIAFSETLSNLNIEYADIGMIHFVDTREVWDFVLNNGILDYAVELKNQGIIKHIGLSSHNPEIALEAVNTGLIEVLLFSVNPCYDLQPSYENVEQVWDLESYEKELTNMEPSRVELYETCQRLGVGITVMKAFGGGDLLNENSPAGVAMTVNQCIHYAMTRPAVASVLVGSHNIDELQACLDYSEASEEEKDYATVLSTFPRISWKGHCMYCGHCAPCPVSINIADVTKYLNLAKAQGHVPETVREHYGSLDAKGGDCIECGQCETRCPFEVEIINNMKSAAETFGA